VSVDGLNEGRILVVDDQLINVRLLQRKLERSGYQVGAATDGATALKEVDENPPNVVLLDIMMPGMDGIEVCQHLKKSKRTRDIPVIFITARNSKEGKIEGLSVGAADYLTKPIDLDETLARVQTQIRIQKQHEENLLLGRELEEAKRRQGVMHMTEGIAHNLNNLLGVAVGYLGLIRSETKENEKVQRNCGQLDISLKRMTRIVEQLTIIGQFQEIDVEDIKLADVLHSGIEAFRRQVPEGSPKVELENKLPPHFVLHSNHELLRGILERILLNAWESYCDTGTAEDDHWIGLKVDRAGDAWIEIQVCDHGKGIPDDIRSHVFDPFVSTYSQVGKGMGLTLSQHAIQSMQGSIELVDNDPNGLRVVLKLPIQSEGISA